jgi:hypothetical protein
VEGAVVNFERFGRNLLDLDGRIIFVGIVDSHHNLLHSCFREETELHSERKVIRNFMMLAPRLTMNELEKSKPNLGSISSVLVRFEKRVFVLSRLNELVIAVGLDVDIPTPVPELINGLIKSAARRAPDLPSPLEKVEVRRGADDISQCN